MTARETRPNTRRAWEARGPPPGGETLQDKDARAVLRLTSDLRHWRVGTPSPRSERPKTIEVAQ